jgi:stearoyl-CoA desaturase (Delta-9 desaturase)
LVNVFAFGSACGKLYFAISEEGHAAMATKADNLTVMDANAAVAPLIASGKSSAAEESLIAKSLRGILYDSPKAKLKNAEHIFYLLAKNIPAAFAVYWIATQPTGWVEWSGFAVLYVMNILAMTLGYHRFFSHKVFETSKPMRYVIAIWAQLGTFGSLGRWVMEHRRHHVHTDLPGDIHSPHYDDHGRKLSGLAKWKYSHLGWVFNTSITDENFYGKGLAEDDAIQFVDRYRIPIFFISVIALHAIACTNSFAHMFGPQRFAVNGQARNNWFVALITMGEGWHNNHHALPRTAGTQIAWYEIDMTGWVIWAMEKLGLIWNVRWQDRSLARLPNVYPSKH